MKGFTLTIFTIIISTLLNYTYSQSLESTWQDSDKKIQVLFYKNNNGKYEGKITGVTDTIKDKYLINTILFKDFTKSENNKFIDGKIFDPKGKKYYDGKLVVKSDEILEVTGYVGIISKTLKWTKYRNK